MRKKVLFFLLLILFSFSFSNEEYISGKIISLVSEEKIENNNENIEKILKYKVKILTGNEKGKIKNIDFPIYKENQYNIEVEIGDKVVLYKSYDENYEGLKNNERIDISDKDKRLYIYYLFGFLFFLILFISKKKGIKGIFALFITITFIVKFFIPIISMGYSPIFLAVLISIFSTTVTIYFITGISKKSFVAVLGTTLGLLIAGMLSYSFANIMKLSGYTDPEIFAYTDLIKNINLRELISAGVIIGSLGAVMDVSVSIASSINEIYENNKNIPLKKLYKSALKIGNDIIGTMINTLVLAYIGASLLTLILIYLQSPDYPLIRILNYEDIVIEILRAVCGSIGIIVTVPLTSFIGAKLYSGK